MRVQLRPFHDDVTLAKVYDHVYDHTLWADHVQRVAWTIAEGRQIAHELNAQVMSDLSCGDGAILCGIAADRSEVKLIFGDLVPADHLDLIGPIEATIESFSSEMPSDLLVMTETLEHLRDPDAVLRAARSRFRGLLVSTPIGEDTTHDNIEHYWSWQMEDVLKMLTEAGWTPYRYARLDLPWYDFQLWGCR